MIPFSQIANPPMPKYVPSCGACEGRGVVPILGANSVGNCSECNNTGKEGNEPEAPDEPNMEGRADV